MNTTENMTDSEYKSVFEGVYQQVLDYTDSQEYAEWGFGVYVIAREQGALLAPAHVSERGVAFLYAVATAKIIGDFDYYLFGDKRFMSEAEIMLTKLSGVVYDDIEGLIERHGDVEEEEYESEYICVQDMWHGLYECIETIHTCLTLYFAGKGVSKDHISYEIYKYLKEPFFVELDDGEYTSPYFPVGGEESAFQFVSNRFVV